MRAIFVTVPAVALVVACGGASSTELFSGPAPEPSASSEPTEPNDPVATADAARDAAALDASPDANDAGVAPKCSLDSECATDICNWKTDRCASPGPIGAPCKRDRECQDGLCNWKLETCSDPAPEGTACRRNKECESYRCVDAACL